MDTWWSYRPSDLLMFSPPIYWRLFESLNRQAWPFVAVLLALGVLVGVWWARSVGSVQTRSAARAVSAQTIHHARAGSARGAAALMALAWFGVAWAFFWQRFAPINSAAETFAWMFLAQAFGFGLLALSPGLRWASALSLRTVCGLALGGWAVIGHPALAALFGRPMLQAEWLGLAPDPTALAALALLLLLDAPMHPFTRALQRALWLLPLLWCAITSLTLWTLGEAQAGVVLVLAGVALGAAALRSR
jgi:hypothetical protein